MMSFVREKKWMGVGLSVIRRGPDNASEVCAKWRDHKMSGFGPPEVGTSHKRSEQVCSVVVGAVGGAKSPES